MLAGRATAVRFPPPGHATSTSMCARARPFMASHGPGGGNLTAATLFRVENSTNSCLFVTLPNQDTTTVVAANISTRVSGLCEAWMCEPIQDTTAVVATNMSASIAGLCEAGMPSPSPHGWVYGVSRNASGHICGEMLKWKLSRIPQSKVSEQRG